jgi:hypothetical protein
VFPLTRIPSSEALSADAVDLRLGVLGVLPQLAWPVVGDGGATHSSCWATVPARVTALLTTKSVRESGTP